MLNRKSKNEGMNEQVFTSEGLALSREGHPELQFSSAQSLSRV